jgi:hypothetical protein
MKNAAVVYVVAKTLDEALAICQSPSCRDKRQGRKVVEKLQKNGWPKMDLWKLTISAERQVA